VQNVWLNCNVKISGGSSLKYQEVQALIKPCNHVQILKALASPHLYVALPLVRANELSYLI